MTLRDLIRSMVVNAFHHLFFVNDKGVPTHVITLTDILDFVIQPDLETQDDLIQN
jgi:predicted transcriptional regulator